MNPIVTKKEARLKNKKRKLAALASVCELNETDKCNKSHKKSESSSSGNTSSGTNVEDEPSIKKVKKIPAILSDEDYAQLKLELNQKKRELNNVPKLRLKLFGDNASLTIPSTDRTPIFMTDVQHLIMYALFGSSSPCIPTRWCVVEKVNKLSHTTIIILDGLSLYNYSCHESRFENLSKIFEHKLEVIMPDNECNGKLMDEILMAPITNIRRNDLINEHGSLEAAIELIKNPVLMVNSIFPVSDASEEPNKPDKVINQHDNFMDNQNEVFPRTQLLLSALQMVEEGYPLPLRGELANRYKNFVMTKDKYKEVTANSPMFGVDCEMCRTSAGVNELTRISIINENHESIYETLVCPQNKIVDYLTPFSGITPQMMKNVTKTLKEVQDDVRKILPSDAILVGQSLQSDLMAMRMMHPYVIDTSIIFNISGDRKRKSKLQTLASEFLGEKIQKNPLGHDSIEDCSASLKLTKLKLEKSIDFGDSILIGRRQVNQKNASLKSTDKTTSYSTNKWDRNAAVITSDDAHSEIYEKIVTNKVKKDVDIDDKIKIFKNASNKYAIQQTCEIVLNHALTLTHLKITDKMLNEDKIEKTIRKLDKWIENVWECVAPNGMCMVLLTGRKSSDDKSSGVALLQIKR